MVHLLRVAKGVGIGCVLFASSVIHASSPGNDVSKSCTPVSIIQQSCPKLLAGKPSPCDNQSTDLSTQNYYAKLKESISKAKELCDRVNVEHGLPGLVVGVTVNGKLIWDEGFGYADVENRVKMEPYSVIRIASISKSITMAMMAKLIEENKINIDCPVQKYLPDFPEKEVDERIVTITTRHLLSHLSGIRHYKKKGEKENKDESEMNLKEYFLKDKFDSIEKSLKLFQDDELHHGPGEKYLYSTHGWTVVSGIIEKITEQKFPKYAKKMFQFWGLKNTYLDEHEPIIYNRTRYYSKNKDGRLINSPYVDNSYKWSGGGYLSNVHDLAQFANMLLFCYQQPPTNNTSKCEKGLPKKPYLKQSTIQQLWTGDARTHQKTNPDFLYGLGFVIGEPMRNCMFCKERDLFTVHHTGGAVGASSVLLLAFPKHFQFGHDTVESTISAGGNSFTNEDIFMKEIQSGEVKGVAVAMITNLTDVGLSRTAHEIANLFKWMLQ